MRYAVEDFSLSEAIVKPDGKIYLEIGAGQSNQVIKIFNFYGWKFERTEKDLSGINRVLVFNL